jgi:putative endonuclease
VTKARQTLGVLGERLARERLEQDGYKVLETNYRTRFGELDLVAIEGGYLVGVEVRTKRGLGFGTPEESVLPRKARRLATLIEQYRLTHRDLPEDLRVDFVAVEMTINGELIRLDVIKNAVTE